MFFAPSAIIVFNLVTQTVITYKHRQLLVTHSPDAVTVSLVRYWLPIAWWISGTVGAMLTLHISIFSVPTTAAILNKFHSSFLSLIVPKSRTIFLPLAPRPEHDLGRFGCKPSFKIPDEFQFLIVSALFFYSFAHFSILASRSASKHFSHFNTSPLLFVSRKG